MGMCRVVRLAAVGSMALLAAAAWSVRGADGPDEGALTDPEKARALWKVPAGFQVSLFAAEPMIHQPIAMAFDGRGRVWLAENDTYSDQKVNFDLTKHDRIVILEDADGDGKAETRKLYWGGAQRLTSVEVGFGGVWALAAPHLLFIPDRDGDDRPDGPPEVVLDGWDAGAVRHNIVNGLKWGPDGWLYGRHGILATSKVGAPATPESARTAINTGIWRYHPIRKVFEVVCHGTTNSWGMDWNERGEPFFINTVIGHLWHAVPGSHYQRMYGEDLKANLYDLLPQTADHVHWDTAEQWSDIRRIGVSRTTDAAGGGHAHSGLMCYLGDNWPEAYRGGLFTINLHGKRLNHDRLERTETGYVARHAEDFAKTTDPWFRAVELTYGPDGGVFVLDWSDVGECHENDGVHRASGRIFKITHGTPRRPVSLDVAKLDDEELVRLHTHANEWYTRQARKVLHERAALGQPLAEARAALRRLADTSTEEIHRLRAMWSLAVIGGADPSWIIQQLQGPDASTRIAAIRILTDYRSVSPAAEAALIQRVGAEPDGLVRRYLASAMQRINNDAAWRIAAELGKQLDIAGDRSMTRTVWYGLEPWVLTDSHRAAELAFATRMGFVSQSIARRLTQELTTNPRAVGPLVELLAKADRTDSRRAVLDGMREALRGYRKAKPPQGWDLARRRFAGEGEADEASRAAVRDLSLVFGDAQALEDALRTVRDKGGSLDSRRDALRALVDVRAEPVVPLLQELLGDHALAAEAVRGLASFSRLDLHRELLERYAALPPAARDEVVTLLAARLETARVLLEAVARGTIARQAVPIHLLRQIQAMGDPEIARRLAETWPELKAASADKREALERWKARLGRETLAQADLGAGRALFQRTCMNCHTLYGEGAKIGPDLTGSQRANRDYLLENLIDPSAMVGSDYRMSSVALADGRVLDGLIAERTPRTLTIQTPTERLTVPVEEVEQVKATGLSLMPEGQLELLSAAEARDLIAYLMSTEQVPRQEKSGAARTPGGAAAKD